MQNVDKLVHQCSVCNSDFGLYDRQNQSIDIGNLDISAAWTDDKKAMTIAIVNPDSTSEKVTPDCGKISLKSKGIKWVISNPDPESYNEPGKAPAVVIKKEKAKVEDSSVVVPPYSISLYRLDVR